MLDGAMGSLLQQKGIKSEGKFWTAKANLLNENLVYQIHLDYINAGADIITTNTFRTNPNAFSSSNKSEFKEIVKAAVSIAKKAAAGKNVLIAASNAPAEDCYQVDRKISKKDLEFNHKKHIDELMKNECDFILNETQSHFDEIKIICDYCSENKIPFVLSLFITEKLRVLSGEKVQEVIKFILDRNPLAIGFNCIIPNVFENLYNKIKLNFNWGVYLNLGGENYLLEKIQVSYSPATYSKIIAEYLNKNPSFVGGCCGSNPNHIKKLRQMLDGKFSN